MQRHRNLSLLSNGLEPFTENIYFGVISDDEGMSENWLLLKAKME